jgi:hypothetical protein
MRLGVLRTFPGRLLPVAALLPVSLLWAQPNPSGRWEGVFSAGTREITLTLDLARNAKPEWIASMGVPSENATGLVVTNLVVSGNSVKFTGVELMMSRFDLTLGADGKMKGTLSGPQGSQPVEFRRTGEPKVELIPPSPAVSKDLEGDWEGSLETPGRQVRIVFHFRNQPDKTVAATIDTPETGGIGLPLNDVRQSGRQVDAGIKIAHATFQGTLNAESTELAGRFTHDQTSFPLTLRKR